MTMKKDKMDELLYSISEEESIPDEILVKRTLNRIRYSAHEKEDYSKRLLGVALILFTLLNCLLPIALFPIFKQLSFISVNTILALGISFSLTLNSILALVIVYFKKSNIQEAKI
ncbi:hypothetical protein [Oceanirhabdus sp. W0125-5]|uniref:hypothetical protein n=1 Tax=Oceanirhabdus sp. W0125-5 TaxID=2999116 RepID=UPI0022F2F300|nr:hypothetical protein [Oceanirhabdus sp. W0125-5]WBW98425.1 hypothetical protein OW730_06560 [Oceanirhabdus sp. W0125-5]